MPHRGGPVGQEIFHDVVDGRGPRQGPAGRAEPHLLLCGVERGVVSEPGDWASHPGDDNVVPTYPRCFPHSLVLGFPDTLCWAAAGLSHTLHRCVCKAGMRKRLDLFLVVSESRTKTNHSRPGLSKAHVD